MSGERKKDTPGTRVGPGVHDQVADRKKQKKTLKISIRKKFKIEEKNKLTPQWVKSNEWKEKKKEERKVSAKNDQL